MIGTAQDADDLALDQYVTEGVRCGRVALVFGTQFDMVFPQIKPLDRCLLTIDQGHYDFSVLGVLAGFSLLWLQPIAMIIGIVMLSAIGYVTLSTGEKPFRAINEHVSPVLGWGWIIATIMANCIWSLPQFALAARAFRQNLMPGTFGPEVMGEGMANFIIVTAIAVICIIMVFFYDSRGLGVKIFNIILKQEVREAQFSATFYML